MKFIQQIFILQLLRLLELKDFCLSLINDAVNFKKIESNLLSESEWTAVEHLISILKPFYDCTIKLQSDNCALSDFYGYWLSISHKLGKITHYPDFIEKLKNQMNDYKDRLLENPVLISAVYLDPRYQRSLSREKRQTAVLFLSGLYRKAISFESEENTVAGQQPDADIDDAFIEFMESLGRDSVGDERITQSESEKRNNLDITTLLENFNGIQGNLNVPVLDFWKSNKTARPELFKLAQIIFAVPPTQTSVERAFSVFAIIFTPRRNQLGDGILQDILLVRLNSDIFK